MHWIFEDDGNSLYYICNYFRNGFDYSTQAGNSSYSDKVGSTVTMSIFQLEQKSQLWSLKSGSGEWGRLIGIKNNWESNTGYLCCNLKSKGNPAETFVLYNQQDS